MANPQKTTLEEDYDSALAGAAFDSIPQALAILDEAGVVEITNEAWRRLDDLNGPDVAGTASQGDNYLERWRRQPDAITGSGAVVEAIEHLLKGSTSRREVMYRSATHRGVFEFQLTISPLGSGRRRLIVSRVDVTEAQWSETKARTLLAVDSDISRISEMSEVTTQVLRELVAALECDTATCFLWDPNEQVYRPEAFIGFTPEQEAYVSEARYARGQPFGSHIEQGLAIVLHDLSEQAWLPRETYEPLSIRQLVVAPIATDHNHHGVVTVAHNTEKAPFRTEHADLVKAVGRRLAYAIENAQLIDELGRASRMKSEFVAMMSHELRTPLHVVLGYAGLMLDEAFGPVTQDQIDSLKRIERSGTALLDLINETLDLSQLDAGRASVEVESIDLPELFRRVANQGGVPVGRDEISYHADIDPNLPKIESDRAKVEVIVRNLLSNAFKFTTEGSVRLEAHPVEKGVSFSVKDTGDGIPPEKHTLIFEPFQQGTESMTRKVGGAGLGLHLVQRYTALLGGTIELESAPDMGSKFTVFLPISNDKSSRNESHEGE